MVDIHCHLLPGMDDGPDALEESLEMARVALADGITHIVATPHASDRFKFLPELVRQRRDEIQTQIGDRLTLATGCDFHLTFENLEDLRVNPSKYTINGKQYLLVEFSSYSLPPFLDETLHQVQLLGLHPIITHPERNGPLRSNPGRLAAWAQRGCYVQVTGQSLQGGFGEGAQKWAEALLEMGLVHFVASDAHNARSRPPKLRGAYETVRARHGEEVARALFVENPRAAFDGHVAHATHQFAGNDPVQSIGAVALPDRANLSIE